MELMRPIAKFAAMCAAVLAAAPGVLAQGCAMCYTEAAAQSPRARHQLDLAILTLLIPSVMMFGGVLVAAFRRRERGLAEDEPGRDPAQTDVAEQTAPFSPKVSPGNS